jgi:alpha-tubulin suppressor-like RCC1 family protein
VRTAFSAGYGYRSALALLLAIVACNDDAITAPVPLPTATRELAGEWSFSDSTSVSTPIEEVSCLNRGVLTFTAHIDSTAADLRLSGTCRTPRGPGTLTMKMEGSSLTITTDSISFTTIGQSPGGNLRESCTYRGRLTGTPALAAGGTVSCSQRGTGTWEMTWAISKGPTMGKLTMIDVGFGHTCSLDTSGQAWCWGANSYGDLGTGDDIPRLSPARVAGNVRFAQIAVAREGPVNCGLTAAGEAWCWGSSWGGVLGDGSGAVQGRPVMIPQRVVGGLTFAQVAPAGSHVCALTKAGKAYCWGTNASGQLGTGDETPSSTPVAVTGNFTFKQVDTYTMNTCGVTTSNDAYCWGEGLMGVLGNVGESDSNIPLLVSGGHKFGSISMGQWLACGVTTGGDGYCWGTGGRGLGTGTGLQQSNTPVLVAGGLKWKSIRAGGLLACGVTTTNEGYCWGGNFLGSLGIGPGVLATDRPVRIAGGLLFDQVVADYQGCGLTLNGIAYCWGMGEDGQVGDGNLRNRFEPRKVAGQR